MMENQEIKILTNSPVIYNCPKIVTVTNTNQKFLFNLIKSDLANKPVITLTPRQSESLGLYLGNTNNPKAVTPNSAKEITFRNIRTKNHVMKSDISNNQYTVLAIDKTNDNKPVNSFHNKIIHENQRNILSNQISNVQRMQKPIKNFNLISNNHVVYRILRPEDLQLQMPSKITPAKRGRPKKVQIEEKEQSEDTLNVIPIKSFRTRSGRITKPPRHIQQESKQINENNCQVEKDLNVDKEKANTPEETMEKIFPACEHAKRNISAQFRCSTCNKAYLGRSRMARHLQLNPSHIAPNVNKLPSKDRLWSELMRTVREAPKHQQAFTFCEEFSLLLQKMRNFIPKLLKPVGEENHSTYVINRVMSDALGISQGKYSLNETHLLSELKAISQHTYENDNNDSSDSNNGLLMTNDIESCAENEDQNIESVEEDNNVQNNDQNSLLNLLDTGQVTFDSTAASEEVMNVDQLVNERLKTLTEAELEAPPNNSQNLSIDLSLDMFTYHTN